LARIAAESFDDKAEVRIIQRDLGCSVGLCAEMKDGRRGAFLLGSAREVSDSPIELLDIAIQAIHVQLDKPSGSVP